MGEMPGPAREELEHNQILHGHDPHLGAPGDPDRHRPLEQLLFPLACDADYVDLRAACGVSEPEQQRNRIVWPPSHS